MTSEEAGRGAVRHLCPGPQCAEPVSYGDDSMLDQRNRLWHARCALSALSNYFRTPLDIEALGDRTVTFDILDQYAPACTPVRFTAPREFLFRAVKLDQGALCRFFVGSNNMRNAVTQCVDAMRAEDFPDGIISFMETHVQTGMIVEAHVHGAEKMQLIGEMVDSKKKAVRIETRSAPICVGWDTVVEPGEVAELTAGRVHLPTAFDHLSVTDWDSWTIEGVKVCCFSGDSEQERQTECRRTVIKERITPLPTFLANTGEWVSLRLRNEAPFARRLQARIYGTAHYASND